MNPLKRIWLALCALFQSAKAESKRWLLVRWQGIKQMFDALVFEILSQAKIIALNRKGTMAYDTVDVLLAVMMVGTLGVATFNYDATNFSAASSSVQTVLGTVVPIMGAIACGFIFMKRRGR